jgi:hypothetical protein
MMVMMAVEVHCQIHVGAILLVVDAAGGRRKASRGGPSVALRVANIGVRRLRPNILTDFYGK